MRLQRDVVSVTTSSADYKAGDIFDKIINCKFYRKSGRTFTLRSDYEPVWTKSGELYFKTCQPKPEIEVQYKEFSVTEIGIDLIITNLTVYPLNPIKNITDLNLTAIQPLTFSSADSFLFSNGDPVVRCIVDMGYRNQFYNWGQYRRRYINVNRAEQDGGAGPTREEQLEAYRKFLALEDPDSINTDTSVAFLQSQSLYGKCKRLDLTVHYAAYTSNRPDRKTMFHCFVGNNIESKALNVSLVGLTDPATVMSKEQLIRGCSDEFFNKSNYYVYTNQPYVKPRGNINPALNSDLGAFTKSTNPNITPAASKEKGFNSAEASITVRNWFEGGRGFTYLEAFCFNTVTRRFIRPANFASLNFESLDGLAQNLVTHLTNRYVENTDNSGSTGNVRFTNIGKALKAWTTKYQQQFLLPLYKPNDLNRIIIYNESSQALELNTNSVLYSEYKQRMDKYVADALKALLVGNRAKVTGLPHWNKLYIELTNKIMQTASKGDYSTTWFTAAENLLKSLDSGSGDTDIKIGNSLTAGTLNSIVNLDFSYKHIFVFRETDADYNTYITLLLNENEKYAAEYKKLTGGNGYAVIDTKIYEECAKDKLFDGSVSGHLLKSASEFIKSHPANTTWYIVPTQSSDKSVFSTIVENNILVDKKIKNTDGSLSKSVFFEGCMPVREAYCFGVPVICSKSANEQAGAAIRGMKNITWTILGTEREQIQYIQDKFGLSATRDSRGCWYLTTPNDAAPDLANIPTAANQTKSLVATIPAIDRIEYGALCKIHMPFYSWFSKYSIVKWAGSDNTSSLVGFYYHPADGNQYFQVISTTVKFSTTNVNEQTLLTSIVSTPPDERIVTETSNATTAPAGQSDKVYNELRIDYTGSLLFWKALFVEVNALINAYGVQWKATSNPNYKLLFDNIHTYSISYEGFAALMRLFNPNIFNYADSVADPDLHKKAWHIKYADPKAPKDAIAEYFFASDVPSNVDVLPNLDYIFQQSQFQDKDYIVIRSPLLPGDCYTGYTRAKIYKWNPDNPIASKEVTENG